MKHQDGKHHPKLLKGPRGSVRQGRGDSSVIRSIFNAAGVNLDGSWVSSGRICPWDVNSFLEALMSSAGGGQVRGQSAQVQGQTGPAWQDTRF
jgi:hypothetical protein